MTKNLQNELREYELISQICAGKSDLFYALVEPYQRTVFSIAYSVLNNAADAEEVAQEAFLKTFKGLKNFRGEAKFSTWLIQITLNEARARLRGARRNLHQSQGYIDEEVEPELKARMELHFRNCKHCKAVLDGTRNTVRLLADGDWYPLPAGFSERLYQRLSLDHTTDKFQ